MIATIVHTDELLQTIAASVIAGVGVTVAFSVGIWGTVQFVELSRGQRSVAAIGAAAVAALAFIAVVAALIVGIIVMTSK